MTEPAPQATPLPETPAAPAEMEGPSLDEVIQEAPPITPESVVSKPEAEPAAPDSSILSSKIEKMLSRDESIQQRRTQEQEYTKLQEELRILRTLHGPDFQQKYNEVNQKVETADDDQSSLMKNLQGELEQMKQSQDALQAKLTQKEQENELIEASHEVTSWVKGNNEHFPLINEIGQQALVFQKMWNTKQQTGHLPSETQAARDVETELRGIVEQCAPLLGYQKREEQAEREEPISTTTPGLSISEPVDRDHMSDDEYMQYLISQHQG